jgi:hypothetical protein
MANGWYGKALAAFGNGQVAWLTDDIRIQLIDATFYVPSLAGHEYLEHVPAGARLGEAVALTDKTNVLGVLGAADAVLPLVTAPTAEYLLVMKWTGLEGSTRLLRLFDTATGLPTIVLTAHNVHVQWPGGVVGRLR